MLTFDFLKKSIFYKVLCNFDILSHSFQNGPYWYKIRMKKNRIFILEIMNYVKKIL